MESYKEVCEFCGKEFCGLSEGQALNQKRIHILSKHKDKFKIEGEK